MDHRARLFRRSVRTQFPLSGAGDRLATGQPRLTEDWLLLGRPTMRQQRPNIASSVCRQAREHILQISERIMPIELG